MLPLLAALVTPLWLAQTSDASPIPVASAVPSPIVSAVPSPEIPATEVRRGPATAPRMIRGDALIRNSGSTNGAGYTVVIRSDFTADVSVAGTSERKKIGAPQGRWLFAKLREAMPLEGLGAGRCMKSTSFGSSTTVSYDGSTTPDLSCGGDAAVRELSRTIGVIAAQLRIEPSRRRFGQP